MERAHGFAEQGGEIVFTAGLGSDNLFQESYPFATMTVFYSGTTTLAVIYADNQTPPTPMPNPFTANIHAFWYFYAANGRYDVMIASPMLPVPWTIGDILLNDTIGGGGVGSQTPWLSNIDASCFVLLNLGGITACNNVLPITGNVSVTGGCYQIGGVSFACSDGAGGVALTGVSTINGSTPGGGGGGGGTPAGAQGQIQFNAGGSPPAFGAAAGLVYNVSTGNMGIGRSAPAYTLDVNGNVNASGFLVNGVPIGTGSGNFWVAGTAGAIQYTGGPVMASSFMSAGQFSMYGNPTVPVINTNGAFVGAGVNVYAPAGGPYGIICGYLQVGVAGGAAYNIAATGTIEAAQGFFVTGAAAGGGAAGVVINAQGQFVGPGVNTGAQGVEAAYVGINTPVAGTPPLPPNSVVLSVNGDIKCAYSIEIDGQMISAAYGVLNVGFGLNPAPVAPALWGTVATAGGDLIGIAQGLIMSFTQGSGGGGGGGGFWTASAGGGIYYNGPTTIGGASPDTNTALTVIGNQTVHGNQILVGTSAAPTPSAAIIGPSGNGMYSNWADGTGGQIATDWSGGGSFFPLRIDASALLLDTTSNGNVGIRNSNPQYPLDVTGAINCTGGFLVNGQPITSGPSGGYWVAGSGGAIYYSGGPVGVGTSTPGGGVGSLSAAGYWVNGGAGPVINSSGAFVGAGVDVTGGGGFGVAGASGAFGNPASPGNVTVLSVYGDIQVDYSVLCDGQVISNAFAMTPGWFFTNSPSNSGVNIDAGAGALSCTTFINAGITCATNGIWGGHGVQTASDVDGGNLGITGYGYVVNSSGVFVGSAVNTGGAVIAGGGVQTNNVTASGSVTASGGYGGGSFNGAGVNVGSNGIEGGFIESTGNLSVLGSATVSGTLQGYNITAQNAISASGQVSGSSMYASNGYSGGAFTGAGVNVGGYGINGAYLQVNGNLSVGGAGQVSGTFEAGGFQQVNGSPGVNQVVSWQGLDGTVHQLVFQGGICAEAY